MMTRLVSIPIIGVMLFLGLGGGANAGPKRELSADILTEVRKLDRQFVEALQKKDINGMMNCYWNSPEIVVVFPDGMVHKGWENVRRRFEHLFSELESGRLEITESFYWPSGDAVLGFGSMTAYLKPNGMPEQQSTIRFTDFMIKQGGRWVYAHYHTHTVVPHQPPRSSASLYTRLGGYDSIAAVVDDFLGRLKSDAGLNRFFAGVGTNRARQLRQLVVDQLCAATGGPCVYTGRDMRTAHSGLGISEQDWGTATNLLIATLDKFQLPKKEKEEVLTAISSLKADIVEK